VKKREKGKSKKNKGASRSLLQTFRTLSFTYSIAIEMANRSFNYSKWDNIELSDDESDLHPNIDKVRSVVHKRD
jgi:hypothetical protein